MSLSISAFLLLLVAGLTAYFLVTGAFLVAFFGFSSSESESLSGYQFEFFLFFLSNCILYFT